MDNRLTKYLLKHSKKKDNELKYDFMPPLLEIIERPAHKGGTVIILGVFLLLVTTIIWSTFSKIDVVITAAGSLQPEGKIKIIKSNSSGTIDAINIVEGQLVDEGDILFQLNTEVINIDIDQLYKQREILEAQRDIYNMILDDKDMSELDLSVYDSSVRNEVESIIKSDSIFKNSINSYEKEKVNNDLNKQIAQYNIEEYNKNNMTQQVRIQELMIQQYDLAIESIDIQIKDATLQYSAQINSKQFEIENELNDLDSKIDKYNLAKDDQTITSPVRGYINSISVNQIGDTVSSTQELAYIVPIDEPIEMFCYVKNMDIADIDIGMDVEIKLDAYPYNKYGTVKGKVKYISPSSFVNDQLGSVYLIKVRVLNKNNENKLTSGLTGNVEIKIGKRTVMDYFLDPIMKGFGESLKEK